MKKIAIAFVALLALFACSEDDNDYSGGNNQPANVQFTVLKDGELSGEEVESGYYVIKTAEQWADFKGMVNSVHDAPDEFEGISVNFNVSDVLAVVDEQHNSGGFDIAITSVSRADNTATVKVVRSGDGNAATVLTQPYHVISIPKSNNEFAFDEDAPQ